jgi:hypothetical protein
MRIDKRLWLLAALGVLSVGVLRSQSSDVPKSDEYLLLGSPNRGAGEPWVFVNPKDPNNILVVAMQTLNRLPSGEPPVARGSSNRVQMRIKELSTPDGSLTGIAVTHDGGNTWTFSEDNFRKDFDKNRCSDSFAGATVNGTLYYGCIAYLDRGDADYKRDGYAPNGEAHIYHGGQAMAWSTDEGETWSDPVWVHPALSPQLYAPTVKPVIEQASPWDRPIFVSDASTGAIYISGSGMAYTVDPSTLKPFEEDPSIPGMGYPGYPPADVARNRTFLRASHDGGRTWGVIYTADSDEYPGGRGGFSAAFGNLVVSYTASSVPTSLNITCPCTVLGISRDDGKTFTYHIAPALPLSTTQAPQAGPGRGPAGPMLSADPTKEGRYAIARQSGNQILVSLTEDGAKTWLPPVVAAEVPAGATFGHRAMKYSPNGDLGLIWKVMYSDGSFDVWSSASRDAARTFKTVRVSHAVSPPCDRDRCNFGLGDDLSSMDIDSNFLYAVWGDNRSGFLGTWFGRIPLSAY